MPFTRPNLTRTLPRPVRRRPTRPVRISGGVGAPTSQVIYPWNFAIRAWISFDPPNTPIPTWIEITGFVDTQQPITITHGRADGIADVNATTLSATVDNSDGRWSTGNVNGVWYGLIRKGSWFRLEVLPPSGNVSSRFVGFLNNLPTTWEGLYASSQITASDRFERLGQAPAIVSSIQSEVLTDPNLAGNVQSYWNLHEASSTVYGQLSFGDTSGNASRPLVATSLGGVILGTGLGVGNATAPGFDGLKSLTFSPTSATQGTYLSGQVTMPTATFDPIGINFVGAYGTLEFWFQATTVATNQYIATLYDPTAACGFTVWYDNTGSLNLSIVATAAANTAGSSTLINGGTAQARVDDGTWHHVVLGVQTTSAGGGWIQAMFVVDGFYATIYQNTYAGAGNNISRLILGAGYTPGTPVINSAAVNLSDAAWTWAGNASFLTNGPFPDYLTHRQAGATGFLGESTDQRVARVARYAGIPIPLTTTYTTVAGLGLNTIQIYAPGIGPWTNLSPGAHACGTQSMSGRAPLDVMQEAARTEGMPLYIDRSGYLAMQPSTVRQNTSPAWTVDSRDLDPSSAQANDFTYTTNQATVTPNGQAAQTVIGATGSAGRLSQAKYGVYTNGGSVATASLNPTEAQSLGLSLIQLRADPGPRWSPLVVEAATLATQAGYGSAWLDAVLATEISTPIRVTNQPSQIGGALADMFVEGWTETITSGNIVFSFNISPIQGATYQLDDAVLGRLDTDGSTIATPGGISSSALTFQLSTTGAGTGSALWTTNAADFPLDINIGGEQVTLSGITGASSPQTATASARSVNGVVASHPFGTAVTVWTPLTLAY